MPLLMHPKIARSSNKNGNVQTWLVVYSGLEAQKNKLHSGFWWLLLADGYGLTFISNLFLSILPSLAQAQIALRSCKLCQEWTL